MRLMGRVHNHFALSTKRLTSIQAPILTQFSLLDGIARTAMVATSGSLVIAMELPDWPMQSPQTSTVCVMEVSAFLS